MNSEYNTHTRTHTHSKKDVAFAKKTIMVAKEFVGIVSNDTDLN